MTLTRTTESGTFIVEDFESGRRMSFTRYDRGAVVHAEAGVFVLDAAAAQELVEWLEGA